MTGHMAYVGSADLTVSVAHLMHCIPEQHGIDVLPSDVELIVWLGTNLLFWGKVIVRAGVGLQQGTSKTLQKLLRRLQVKQLSQL
jgi:hypothetical protein